MKTELDRRRRELSRLYRELETVSHEISREMGLSDSAFLILYSILDMGEGCLQKEIANQYSASPQTINSSVQNLRKRGLIEAIKGKKHEMRLYLTPGGKLFAREKILPVLEMERSVFEEMSAGQSRELLRLTEKYTSLYRKKAKLLRFRVEESSED